MSGRIFINYRRGTSAAAAGRLYDRLTNHFGKEGLFMDVDAIEPGLDFVKALDEQVTNCRALIAVLSPGWAGLTDAEGRQRLDNPSDYVRIEIEAALKRDIRVIPVLVDGAQMPTAEELPPSLGSFARRQAIEVSHARFASDVDLLASAIARGDGTSVVKPNQLSPALIRPENPKSLAEELFSFQGRIPRRVYWKGLALLYSVVLFFGIAAGVYLILDTISSTSSGDVMEKLSEISISKNWRAQFLTIVTALPLYWPYCALVLKRLHDINQGWQLLGLLMLINVCAVVLMTAGYPKYHTWAVIISITVSVLLGLISGQPGDNRYGADPLASNKVKAAVTSANT
jgi:uncharacterized membrane protein YhaH (DUF805 family)